MISIYLLLDLERTFRVTEYRFIRKRQNNFITNRKEYDLYG